MAENDIDLDKLYDNFSESGKHFDLTVQTCSTITRFITNPLSVTGIVDAVDRYFAIFGRKPLRIRWILLFYCAFPLTGVLASVYNTWISNEFVKDDMICPIARGSEATKGVLFVVQWISIICAMIFYFVIYRKLSKHAKMLKLINKDLMYVTLIGWVLLDSTIPFIWTVYLFFVPSLKNRARDLCNCAPQITNVSAFVSPAQSSSAI
ncbi:hypothetical protein WR25_08665 [Diploscapter pachys]|uniref:Uncharacterized protein n=1 Tax=Diploscapter pachys TaxID=2018661 RepID=A0A2A2LNR9_9BILA|nr:hypothetical protein WR25_08665 [Diploscapter pachys]